GTFGESDDNIGRRRTAFGEVSLAELVNVNTSYAGVDVCGVTEFKYAEGRLYKVAGHIAQGTCTVIPPAAPVEGDNFFNVVLIRRCTEPQIPIEFLGNRCCL